MEVARELVARDPPVMPLSLPHAQGHQATRARMPLGPLRTGLTALAPEVRRASTTDVFAWCPAPVEAAPLGRRPRPAVGGVVRGAVSDDPHLQPPPAASRLRARPDDAERPGAAGQGPSGALCGDRPRTTPRRVCASARLSRATRRRSGQPPAGQAAGCGRSGVTPRPTPPWRGPPCATAVAPAAWAHAPPCRSANPPRRHTPAGACGWRRPRRSLPSLARRASPPPGQPGAEGPAPTRPRGDPRSPGVWARTRRLAAGSSSGPGTRGASPQPTPRRGHRCDPRATQCGRAKRALA